jgi:hypothetical protein
VLWLALTAFFYALMSVWPAQATRLRVVIASLGFVALLGLPLNALRIYGVIPLRLGRHLSSHQALVMGVLGFVGLCVLLLAWRGWRRLPAVMRIFLIALAPFSALMLARSAIALATLPAVDASYTPKVAGKLTDSAASSRVVWLLFDELDYDMVFARRPRTLDLPEFDRLRNESVFATQATPPGTNTQEAMTSLIIGQRLLQVQPETATEISALLWGSRKRISSRTESSVFGRLRASGHDAYVVGWALPYCQLWADQLSGCEQEPVFTDVVGRGRSFAESLYDQAQAISPLNRRRLAIDAYRNIMAATRRRLATARTGLVFVHLPVPHHPPIFDRARESFSQTIFANYDGYLGNLRLADETLGEIRRLLEAEGTWEQTHVLVMADHPWREIMRTRDPRSMRVPYLLKLAGRQSSRIIATPFETTITGQLLLLLLDGQLSSEDDIERWIQERVAQRSHATAAPPQS